MQVIGGNAVGYMRKHNVKYTRSEIGKVKILPDFLLSPDKLILKEEAITVTVSLTIESVDFFKHEAHINHAHYVKHCRLG